MRITSVAPLGLNPLAERRQPGYLNSRTEIRACFISGFPFPYLQLISRHILFIQRTGGNFATRYILSGMHSKPAFEASLLLRIPLLCRTLKRSTSILSPSVLSRMTSPIFIATTMYCSGNLVTRASLNGNSRYCDSCSCLWMPDFMPQLLETISFSLAILAVSCGITTGYSYPLLSGKLEACMRARNLWSLQVATLPWSGDGSYRAYSSCVLLRQWQNWLHLCRESFDHQ
jgi:hypothetical protein